MKKLLSILLLAPLFSYGQMNRLFYEENFSIATIDALKDSIAVALPTSMKFTKLDTLHKEKNKEQWVYAFRFVDKEESEVNVSFKSKCIGGSKVLGKPCHPVIADIHIIGNYRPIFQIWKKYYDSKADLENIQKKGKANKKYNTGKTDTNNDQPEILTISFSQIVDAYWEISIEK